MTGSMRVHSTFAQEIPMAEPARQPQPQPARKPQPRPAEVVERILDDAQKRPQDYARETIVPKGGE